MKRLLQTITPGHVMSIMLQIWCITTPLILHFERHNECDVSHFLHELSEVIQWKEQDRVPQVKAA